jgi:hypothetical protein
MDEGENSRDRAGRDEGQSLLADDEFYRALSARSRRRVLAHLVECEESTVGELAEVLCGWEATAGEMVTPERYRRVRTELVHIHIPRLADAGLVSYDRETGRAALTARGDRAGDLLRRSLEVEEA